MHVSSLKLYVARQPNEPNFSEEETEFEYTASDDRPKEVSNPPTGAVEKSSPEFQRPPKVLNHQWYPTQQQMAWKNLNQRKLLKIFRIKSEPTRNRLKPIKTRLKMKVRNPIKENQVKTRQFYRNVLKERSKL